MFNSNQILQPIVRGSCKYLGNVTVTTKHGENSDFRCLHAAVRFVMRSKYRQNLPAKNLIPST